jgi:MoaA/NifB/PqqE/SkfB family radical SAM enzyme
VANLVISNVCNLGCSYCFARDFLEGQERRAGENFISMEDFEQRLDFLERSGIEDVRLIGGEPGLHPDFPALLERAAKRLPKLVVFTNGVLGEPALQALEALPLERLTVLVNLSTDGRSGGLSEKERRRRDLTLRRLGGKAIAAGTVCSVDFGFDSFIPLILENGCQKSLRLGLAQPAQAGRNAFLHPRQYPAVGRRIAEFARRAAQAGIRVEFDCGFVRCMFSQPDQEMLAEAKAFTEYRCSPVLDIDLQGKISHCFPLAGRFVSDFSVETKAADVREEFTRRTRAYRMAGIYKECSTCAYKAQGQCTGGCLSATLRRFRKAAFCLK